MFSLEKFIEKIIEKVTGKKIGRMEILLTIFLYVLIFTLFISFLVVYVPVIITQIKNIFNNFQDVKADFSNIPYSQYIMPIIDKIDFKKYSSNGLDYALNAIAGIGKLGTNILLAFLLSLFFMIGRKMIKEFIERFYHSKISGFFKYLRYFARNFLDSFGKVIQSQLIIAFVNSMLSIILLAISGFPNLIALGVMIFILSLIPVAGVIISFIPLSLIAFNIGGFPKVIFVIAMILGLHALESYVLNPKLMSSKTELPVFVVFMVLILSQHLFGIWGLLIGVPLFMFFMDLVGASSPEDVKNKSAGSEKNE